MRTHKTMDAKPVNDHETRTNGDICRKFTLFPFTNSCCCRCRCYFRLLHCYLILRVFRFAFTMAFQYVRAHFASSVSDSDSALIVAYCSIICVGWRCTRALVSNSRSLSASIHSNHLEEFSHALQAQMYKNPLCHIRPFLVD